jgi:hypothetical protein
MGFADTWNVQSLMLKIMVLSPPVSSGDGLQRAEKKSMKLFIWILEGIDR